MRHARKLWVSLKTRALRLGADIVEGSLFSAMSSAEIRGDIGDALTAALEPDERIEFDTWTQMHGKRARAGDPAELDVTTAIGAARGVGSVVGMLRATVNGVGSVLPVRVALTDRRVLISHRTVTSEATVRGAPRSGAIAVRRLLGTVILDLGDGGPPLRLSGTLQGDELAELVTLLGSR